MDDLYMNMYNRMIYTIIIYLIISLVIYVIFSIFINKLHYLTYKRKTLLGWVPIYNIYLLGKLTINNIVGIAMSICTLIVFIINSSDNGDFLSKATISSLNSTYIMALVVLIFYGIYKYYKLKKNNNLYSM